MKKIVCDICKKEINAYDNYDVDGYSQFVTVQTMDSRKYGNEEYQICNSCFEKILTFVTDMKATPQESCRRVEQMLGEE